MSAWFAASVARTTGRPATGDPAGTCAGDAALSAMADSSSITNGAVSAGKYAITVAAMSAATIHLLFPFNGRS